MISPRITMDHHIILYTCLLYTSALLDGETLQDVAQWLRLLVAYDVIFIATAFLLFDFVVEE